VTAHDPHYVTADIKAKLRRKNRLMRAGRVDEASVARQIGRAITRHNKRQLQRIDTKRNSKELWKAVRQLTGRARESAPDPGVTADSLNQHYATVSTDVSYERPPPKNTVAARPGWRHYVTDYKAFMMLDSHCGQLLYRPRQPAGVVSAVSCAGLMRSCCRPHKRLTDDVDSPTPVETGAHPASAESSVAERKAASGRKRMHPLSDLMRNRSYTEVKREDPRQSRLMRVGTS